MTDQYRPMARRAPAASTLSIRNRQRARRVDIRLLRRISRTLLDRLVPRHPFDLCLHLVSAREMSRVNQTFLNHVGPTDVITFDLSAGEEFAGPNAPATPAMPALLHGEIFVCLEVAEIQATEFGTSWQEELARYVAHGLLHLIGYDDVEPLRRRKMKRLENRLVAELKTRFRLSRLELPTKVASCR